MHLLNRYIRNAVLSATCVVVLILIALESFAVLIAQLPDIGKAQFGIVQALLYVPLQLPAMVYLLFPVAGFIGCLIGLGRLATGSELTVMRASGVSILQVLWSVMKAALWMLLFVTLIGECVAPQLQAMGNRMKTVALGKGDALNHRGNIWLRHHNQFVFLDRVVSPNHIAGVTRFQFDGSRHLLSSSFAKDAVKVGGQWVLQQIVGTHFSKEKTQVFHEAVAPLGIALKPDRLQKFHNDSMEGSVATLWHTIHYRKQAGLVTSLFALTFWQRVLQPLTTLVMIALGIPFVFGSLRSVSMGLRILTGIAVGFGFYMLSRFFGPMTLLYQFPPFLAAAIPTGVFIIVYSLMIRRIA